MKTRWLVLLACIILKFSKCATAQIQSETNQGVPQKEYIKILSKIAEDGVWLRWVPTNYVTWQLGNKYGYIVERYALTEEGILKDNKPVIIGPAVIKPYTKQALDELSKYIKEVEILQELIYNAEPATPATDPSALLKQNEDLENRFGIALLVCDFSLRIAQAAGLYVNDKTAVKGERYIYKISIAQNPSTQSIKPAVIVADVKEEKPLQPFNDVTAVFADKKVTLSWSTITHKGVYTAYVIEKSEDGKDFKPINDLPYVQMSQVETDEDHFVDSLAENNKPYFYRVKGITPFAETGPASNVVTGEGKFDLTGTLIIREIKNVKGDVTVRWEFPIEREIMIKGFVVSKASKAEGPYKDVTPKPISAGTRQMIDSHLASSAYYKITAVDARLQKITHSPPYFIHVEDNTPPAVPIELSGKSDKNGIVSLTWKTNTDNDLLGYRIFSSHDPKHEFVEITKKIITTNSYSDTINTKVMNKYIYYTIVAVDNNFNASKYSTPAKVSRPDLISPAPPVLGKIEIKDNAISLHWTNSVSADLSSSRLYRVTTLDTIPNLLQSILPISHWDPAKSQTSYVDYEIKQGKTYEYVLEAYDSTGNMSSVRSHLIKFESGIRKDVTDLKAIIDRDKKIITLQWAYPIPAKKCMLYRKRNDDSFSLYQTLDGSMKEFIDNQVIINNTYSYRIQLILDANVKTKLSESLRVQF